MVNTLRAFFGLPVEQIRVKYTEQHIALFERQAAAAQRLREPPPEPGPVSVEITVTLVPVDIEKEMRRLMAVEGILDTLEW
jgi:hypothetical protein